MSRGSKLTDVEWTYVIIDILYTIPQIRGVSGQIILNKKL